MADESGEKPETEGAGGGVAAGEAPAGAESAAADDAAGSASPKPSADKGASDAAPDDTSTPKDTQGGEGGGESRAAGTEGAPQAEAPTSPAVDAIATPAAAEGGEASPGGDDAPQDGGARRVSLATESSVASDASVASVRATVASMAADVKAGRMTKEELFKALAGMKAAAAATGGRDGGAAPRAPRAPGGGAPPLPAAADSSDARDGDAPQLASKPSWYHNSREWEAMPFIERSQSWYVQRERDRAEREAKEASEMFSPSLTKLPTWYESAREWEKLPFATRSRLWQERCDRERSRRELLEADALVTRDGATFRPAVDSMSRSIVAAKRVGGGTGFAQPDSPAGGDGGSSTRRGAMSTPERLYRDAKLRQERREEAAKRKESQDDAKFSHTPTLSSSRAYKEVQGVLQINKDPQGMMKRVKSHSQRRASPRPKDPNCTFSPVLVAKPRGSALKQYLTRPAHERLSDVARPSPSASPASSARSPAQHGARRVRSSPSDASPRSVRSEFGRVGRPATTVDPKFKEFVERVDADAAKRKQKQMELQQRLAEATPFKPDTSATRRSEVAQQAKSKILKVAREKTRSLFDNFYKEEHMKPVRRGDARAMTRCIGLLVTLTTAASLPAGGRKGVQVPARPVRLHQVVQVQPRLAGRRGRAGLDGAVHRRRAQAGGDDAAGLPPLRGRGRERRVVHAEAQHRQENVVARPGEAARQGGPRGLHGARAAAGVDRQQARARRAAGGRDARVRRVHLPTRGEPRRARAIGVLCSSYGLY